MPSLEQYRRQNQRAPVNPLDISTIVSIYPRKFVSVKHTLQPGEWTIQAGSISEPSIQVIGPSSWWKQLDDDQPDLEISVSSIRIAHSIIHDYCNGLLGWSMNGRGPGIFYIPGNINRNTLFKEYKSELDKAMNLQKEWYKELVLQADSLWARTGGNPISIPDDARLAARELGMDAKEWLKDYEITAKVKCKACGALRDPQFPVCGSCHAVDDKELFAKLGLQFAN